MSEYLRYYQLIDETTKEEYSRYLFGRPFDLLLSHEKCELYKYQLDMKNPTWKYLYLYDKLTKYSVSNTGEIRNNENGMILAKRINKYGYQIINLTIEDREGMISRKTFRVHRLIAKTFIPNPENKPQVNHKNGNKTCNWVGNLEWVTCKENIEHAIRTELRNTVGVNNPKNRFSEETIRAVCNLLQSGKEATEIAKLTGCSKTVVQSIKQGKIWKSISCNYEISKTVNKTKPKEFRQYMFELIMAGYSDKEIAKELDLPMNDRAKSIAYVNLARRRYFMHTDGK